MTVDMGLDIESIEALDFEYAPPCESTTTECDKTAEWFWITSCCGTLFLVCEEHHEEVLNIIKNNPDMKCVCIVCNTVITIKEFYMSSGRI